MKTKNMSRGTSTPAKPASRRRAPTRAAQRTRLATLLPTQLERDTMLTPLWVAESVVAEVECFLKAELPAKWARRLAAKAHYLYPRHKHFNQMLNRPGNLGRHNLCVYMRHWTAGWLNRERSPLYRKLPQSFGMGRPLPV